MKTQKFNYRVDAENIKTFYVVAEDLQEAQKEAVREIYNINPKFNFEQDEHTVIRVQKYEIVIDGEVIAGKEIEFDDAYEFDDSPSINEFENDIRKYVDAEDFEKFYQDCEADEEGWYWVGYSLSIEIRKA